ncbi:hypothetical protein ABPG75_000859 [Micractinium tetrahymenae]
MQGSYKHSRWFPGSHTALLVPFTVVALLLLLCLPAAPRQLPLPTFVPAKLAAEAMPPPVALHSPPAAHPPPASAMAAPPPTQHEPAHSESRRERPGPPVCHPDCSKYGVCSEDNHCRCPFGRVGKACEVDFLGPCRQTPQSDAHCDMVATRSCECLRRCREFFCLGTPSTDKGRVCHNNDTALETLQDRPCFTREGLPPEEQHSRFPEPGEDNVKCYKGDHEGAEELPCSEAAVHRRDVTRPLSACPSECNMRGYCMKLTDEQAPYCHCDRGYTGEACEKEEGVCYKNCSGHGKCIDQFCHCKPPYFSIGCTRSTVYPAYYSIPSPVSFQIYMYELDTSWAYEHQQFPAWKNHDPIYTAYQQFLDQFLNSSFRTEDPSAANLFYIPMFAYSYSSNTGQASNHLNAVIHHVKHAYPWWNRTDGLDHFFWVPKDRGACDLTGDALNAIKVTHFGLMATEENHGTLPPLGHPRYGCCNPHRDVVAPPFFDYGGDWSKNTQEMGLQELLEGKTRLFFFAGEVLHDDLTYSGAARQILHNLTKEWADPSFEVGACWVKHLVNRPQSRL